MSAEGHWCGPKSCPECGETHGCICGNDCDEQLAVDEPRPPIWMGKR